MNTTCVEIRSPLWQRLLAVALSALIGGVGGAFLLTAIWPTILTSPKDIEDASSLKGKVEAIFLAAVLLSLAIYLLREVLRYRLVADQQGIQQWTGFRYQAARWDAVASYSLERNRKYHSQRPIEPILRDGEGKIIFQALPPIFISTSEIERARRELWQFVEKQLVGKETPPLNELDPHQMAVRSLNVNWAEKSLRWKIARITAIVCYALFWFSVSMVPLYWLTTNNVALSSDWVRVLLLPMYFGPLIPHMLWVMWKERKIKRRLRSDKNAKPNSGNDDREKTKTLT